MCNKKTLAVMVILLATLVVAWGQTTVRCYPTDDAMWTGYTDGTTNTDGNVQAQGGNGTRGWMVFDISGVPEDGAVITGVTLGMSVTSSSTAPYGAVTAITNCDPRTADAATLYADLDINDIDGCYSDISDVSEPGWKTIDLATLACVDVGNCLYQNWWAVGIHTYDIDPSAYLAMAGHADAQFKPFIDVTYDYFTPEPAPDPAAVELITNGDFESTTGWTYGGGFARTADASAHSGGNDAQASTANSYIEQSFTSTALVNVMSLSFWAKSNNISTESIIVTNTSGGRQKLTYTLSGTGTWYYKNLRSGLTLDPIDKIRFCRSSGTPRIYDDVSIISGVGPDSCQFVLNGGFENGLTPPAPWTTTGTWNLVTGTPGGTTFTGTRSVSTTASTVNANSITFTFPAAVPGCKIYYHTMSSGTSISTKYQYVAGATVSAGSTTSCVANQWYWDSIPTGPGTLSNLTSFTLYGPGVANGTQYFDEILVTKDSTAPQRFNLTSPSPGATSQPINNLALNWASSFGAYACTLYIGTTNANPPAGTGAAKYALGNVTTYTLNGLSVNTTYYWNVKKVTNINPYWTWSSNGNCSFTTGATPTLTSIYPTTVTAGGVSFVLTVTGTDFVSGTSHSVGWLEFGFDDYV